MRKITLLVSLAAALTLGLVACEDQGATTDDTEQTERAGDREGEDDDDRDEDEREDDDDDRDDNEDERE